MELWFRRGKLRLVAKKRRNLRGLPLGVLEQVEEYLVACFERESPPRVSELAKMLRFPLGRFVETFQRATGMKPSTYLKRRQVTAAKLLLRRTKLTVDKVGYAVGFGTRRTFFREFRQRTGMSPALYRKLVRNDPSLHRRE